MISEEAFALLLRVVIVLVLATGEVLFDFAVDFFDFFGFDAMLVFSLERVADLGFYLAPLTFIKLGLFIFDHDADFRYVSELFLSA